MFEDCLQAARDAVAAGEILRYTVETDRGGWRVISAESDQGWFCWFDELECSECYE